MRTTVKNISADEVYKALVEKKDAVLVDVRTEGEFSRGKIEGSINIPIDTVTSQIEATVPDKNKTIYMYCLSGSRSDLAAAQLQQLGYTDAFSMTSGLLMWRSKKYPLTT
jgi:rhodanese-related sulfurtransferase